MRPARYFGGGGGFGGGSPMATRLTIAVGAISIAVLLLDRASGGGLLPHLLFTPAQVVRGFELWQIVTYAFVYPLAGGGIIGFLFALLFLYSIGPQIEAVLGSRRLLGFYIASAALGALLTIPVSYLAPRGWQWEWVRHDGVWASLGAFTVLYARYYAHQPIYIFFVLPLQGRQLVFAAFGLLILFGLLGSFVSVLPEGFAMLAALAFAYGAFQPRRTWLRFRAWRIERELKRRTSRFAVIRGGREREKEEGKVIPHKKPDDKQGPWLH